MAFPDPQLGLVISYAYLWHHEHHAGRDEGIKDRPCVVILSVEGPTGGATQVRVAPVTHSAPDDAALALEIPQAVKRHLGLDDRRSWIILDEVNEFAWPGFDLRLRPGSSDSFVYGFLPPRLFEQLLARQRQIWRERRGRATARD